MDVSLRAFMLFLRSLYFKFFLNVFLALRPFIVEIAHCKNHIRACHCINLKNQIKETNFVTHFLTNWLSFL